MCYPDSSVFFKGQDFEDMNAEKAALVTGGSRGLGREIALALGRGGYSVCVNYLSDKSGAEETAGAAGGGSFAIRADVSDSIQVEGVLKSITERYGGLDLLVNNAGITSDALLVKQKVQDWERVVDTNLKGCFNTIRLLAPLMAGKGDGHIINVSSRSGLRGRAGQAAYSASKAALLGLTYSAARELGRDNVRVNAVLPGYMPTDIGARAQGAMQRAGEESLLGVLSSPAEVASFVLWLASTNNVTGQVFCLDSRI
jgi:3-oxoacyl-[acyl-carrier protein] reductase